MKTLTLGFGSSAIVYLALYRPSNISVAVKLLDLDQCDPTRLDHHLEELRRETALMSISKHPNILKILASFVVGQKLWMVTQYVPGGSCLDAMRYSFKDGLDDECLIATTLQHALHGLEYIHSNGSIHRDVKAGNLLIDSDGHIRLADFGVASSIYEGEHRRIRRTFVGTPCWMAPEVMEMNPDGYNFKADIWSLGITALELAQGSAPYSNYPPMKIIYLILSGPPPELQSHKGFSKHFRAFVQCCLQKDPSKRPTCEELLRHPFIKNFAKKNEYIVEHLFSKLIPLNLRNKSESPVYPKNQRLSVDKVGWNFGPETERDADGADAGTMADTGQECSPHADVLHGDAKEHSSDYEENAQIGRFSITRDKRLGESTCKPGQKGRFHIIQKDHIVEEDDDAGPPSAAYPISKIDQLLFLNNIVEHQLVELRNSINLDAALSSTNDRKHKSSQSLSESRN